MELQIG